MRARIAAFVLISAALFVPRARSAAPRPTVVVGKSAYGPVLFDGRGFALYAYTHDPRGHTSCSSTCAKAWPPYVVRGAVRAGRGAHGSLLSTIRRPDGSRQVSYAGRALYYYVGDRTSGHILCQDVFEFGGLWLVVRGNGTVVR